MKKIKFKSLFFVMALAIIIASIPSIGFAEEESINENIGRIKDLLQIGDDYELSPNYEHFDSQGNKTISLYWRGHDESLSLEIDEEGNILSYWRSKYGSYDRPIIYKFPKITREEGEKVAKDFMNKLYPDILDKMKHSDDPYYTYKPFGLRDYNYHYIRVENGIRFIDNNVHISVDAQTGEVTNFNINWDRDLEFPDNEGIISKDEAKEIYKDNMNLELSYRLKGEDNKTYLGYNIVNIDETVDAKTKEIVSTSSKPFYSVYGSMLYQNMGSISLEEENRLINSNEIISREEANEKILDTFDLGEGYELERHELIGNSEKDSYIWDVLVMKYEGNHGSGVNARVDAKTGEILTFSNPGFWGEDTEEAKYTKEELLKKAEEIIKITSPEKYKEVEYVEDENENSFYGDNVSNFLFARKVNGIRVENEGFNILLNNASGNVLIYNHNWSNSEFLSPDNIIDQNEAKEILLEGRELNLEYQREKDNIEDKNIRLVYDFKDKYLIVDAKKAELENSSLDLMDSGATKSYRDIGESFAKEQIEKLQDYIFLFEGDEFKPKEEISQKEFFQLLAQTKDIYYAHDDIAYLYELLIDDGILNKEEKDMDGKVTREEAIKYIIRAFRLEPLYDLGDIYKVEYEDADGISNNLRGHVAKARGLGIIGKGKYFRPKDNLTREEAAVLIYNILNREI